MSENLRVAFCENGAGYGGAVISLAAFLERIPSCFLPHIYTGIGTEDYQQLSKLGIWRHVPPVLTLSPRLLRTCRIPFASTVDNIFNLAPFASRFYRTFRKDRIQLVYLNNDPNCNLAAALAAKFAGIPLILHARGFGDDTKGTRWVLSHIDHCIAVSNAVKEQMTTLGLPSQRCTVVPEGLDMSAFFPRDQSDRLLRELGLSGREPVITLVGGLVDWKGQDVLLEAAPMILEKYPSARILLVGAPYGRDNSFANMIASRAEAPSMKGRVLLLGARKDIPEILSISSVVIHASTKPEPFGRTFLEGMAMGKPVIASAEGGPSEVIENGIDGLLIQPRVPRLLAAAVIRLLSERQFAETLGRNAARKAATYSIQNHEAAISAVLRRYSSK